MHASYSVLVVALAVHEVGDEGTAGGAGGVVEVLANHPAGVGQPVGVLSRLGVEQEAGRLTGARR